LNRAGPHTIAPGPIFSGAPVPTNATLSGIAAILLWSTLASLTAAVPQLPPFQLAAMSFAIATLVGLGYGVWTENSLRVLAKVPMAQWALGVYGLLGYHVCYFAAFRNAPPLEVNLVNYLWPLLIVVFCAFLPARLGGKRLSWQHILGAALGLAGTLLVLLGGSGLSFELSGHAAGYLAALAAALIWSSHSVASRLFAAVPSFAVIGSCALTAVGAAAGHLAFEQTVWPADSRQWLIVLAQGLGPVGLAFYLWDAGMKHGNIRLIGVLSYATPLLSTLLLAVLGLGEATWRLWLAALMVTAGALLAGREQVRKSG
jgi:drug/metabolite transporter (DMT)-like permease